ncbi:FctA domain-containing protein [Collinsella sp. CLA-ER-H2]|uniref:Spy0128 family protein n=1 Tax=Collinsella sp. CLA-ER-H2 TaxID=3136220 RepID=UPI0032C10FE2
MKANSDKSKQSNKATRRVLAGVLCGASVLSLVLSLVMPPISQAIANDGQVGAAVKTVADEGSLGEDAGADNAADKGAEDQNSDETEGDEADSSNGVEQGQSEDQLEDEQRGEDGETSDDNAVKAVAENEQAETASDEMIDSADKLKTKLEGARGTVNFMLTEDIDLTNDNDNNKTIQLGNDGSNITLDLNGHKIKYASNGQPLFNITGGATLTVKDGTQTAPTKTPVNQEKMNGNLASMECDDSNIPNKLTYYVTESVAKGTGTTEITGTTETLKEYKVDIKGAIVACGDHANLRLVNLYKTGGKFGTFNLESGAITQQQNSRDQNNSVNNRVSSLVYAEEDSTVNMSGGYVCGATSMGHGAGIELGIKNGKGATLNLTGGVIAGNYAPEGGGVYADGSTINMTGDTTGGTISGNGTFKDRPGFGAGICAKDSMVTILNGYITNNKYQHYDESHKGNGCHGGGGIAAFNDGSLTIAGGYITGNYSAEAGGGVYAGAWNSALSGFTFSGGTIASNVAQNSEGGGIRIAAPTVGEFNVSGKKAYITNNTTNTTNDWGGGGVFVQGGNSDKGVNSASLKIYNALITNNDAEGFGGGFAACPTGKTAITDTKGIAIFGNRDENGAHLSGGTNGKNEDQPTTVTGGEITDTFKQNGHKDLFLIRKSDNSDYIAAVTGQMLGGGAANWKGTIDGQPSTIIEPPTTIGKYEGAQAKYMIGLEANPSPEDQGLAASKATLFITGNSSNIHGGGIMTNGNVFAGSTQGVQVYPKMKLNGSKVFEGGTLKGNDFDFQLLKQNEIKDENGQVTGYTVPSFDANDTLQLNGCSVVNTVKNDGNGNFTFDLGEVYADDALVYYLVEVPGADKDVVNYDKTIYKIDPTVIEDPTRTHDVLGIKYTYYKVSNVKITKMSDGATETVVTPTSEDGVACVALTGGATFTNTPYTSNGSWTPKATKVVEGGEMKEFTLEFADNPDFAGAQTVKTTANDKKTQTLEFHEIKYDLGSLKQNDSGVPGRGASKTFTYYVREKNDSSFFSHYKFDKSVYKFTVVATDKTDGAIDCQVTYRKGTVGSDGKWVSDDTADHKLTDTTPTFTNTYSTSLPLSGMSGVSLTYLAGAAVLCAAAAWMHIRRKANAKGGERRE